MPSLQNSSVTLTDLDGVTLNLVHYDNGRITGFEDPANPGLLTGGSLTEQIIRDMQKNLNFQVNLINLGIKDPSDSDYFERGVGHALQSGAADMSIQYLFLTAHRVHVASPLHPIFMDGIFALFVQPSPSAVKNIYMDPLQPGVWISWFLALFSIFCACSIYTNRKNRENLRRIPRIIAEAIFTTIASISQSGYTSQNISTGFSTSLIIISAILSMSIYAVFNGQLLAAILRPTNPIKSLDDLLEHDFTFYCPPPFKNYFLRHEKLHLSKLNLSKFQSSEAWLGSMKAMFTETHAHLDVGIDSAGGMVWHNRLWDFDKSADEFCNSISSIKILKSNLGLANTFYVAKNSKLKNLLNKSILRIQESGLIRRYLNHPVLRCSPSVKRSYDENLGMDDVSFAFILFFILLISSHSSLLVEILYHYFKRLKLL